MSNIKPGDKILITRRATDEEWEEIDFNRCDKDDMVGKTLTVGGIYGHAPLLWTRENTSYGNNCYPLCICQKVEDEPHAEAAPDTITITIPAPPKGFAHEKRQPNTGEEFYWYSIVTGQWRRAVKGADDSTTDILAFRQRDEYAERYEALKLPDGYAWFEYGSPIYESSNIKWSNQNPNFFSKEYKLQINSIRQIHNHKAYKIGEEPK